MSPKYKKKLIKDPEEFNKYAKYIEVFQKRDRKYGPSIKQEGYYAIIKTPKIDYLFDLTGEGNDEKFAIQKSSIILSVAIALSKINYDKIDKDLDRREKYGYRETHDKDDCHKTHIKWNISPAVALSWVEEEFANQELKCWSYDINSSYPAALLKPMPDTTKEPYMYARIKENQIGFDDNGAVTTDLGVKMKYVFDLMPSPFTEYVLENYEAKKQAKSKEEKLYYKSRLNYLNGLLARHNIFLYNTVLYYAARKIRSYLDEYSVYCNVDSIVSTVERPDIEIGNGIGQFKIEHINQKFKYLSPGIYQWEDECGNKDIHYKGLEKQLVSDISNPQYKENLNTLKYMIKDNRVILRNGE